MAIIESVLSQQPVDYDADIVGQMGAAIGASSLICFRSAPISALTNQQRPAGKSSISGAERRSFCRSFFLLLPVAVAVLFLNLIIYLYK